MNVISQTTSDVICSTNYYWHLIFILIVHSNSCQENNYYFLITLCVYSLINRKVGQRKAQLYSRRLSHRHRALCEVFGTRTRRSMDFRSMVPKTQALAQCVHWHGCCQGCGGPLTPAEDYTVVCGPWSVMGVQCSRGLQGQ